MTNQQVLIDIEVLKLYWRAPDNVKEEFHKIYGRDAFGLPDMERVWILTLRTIVEESMKTPVKYEFMINGQTLVLECRTYDKNDPAATPSKEEFKEGNFWEDVVEKIKASGKIWKR